VYEYAHVHVARRMLWWHVDDVWS